MGTAAQRPRGQRPAGRRDGAQGRGGTRVGGARRRCSPKRSATRNRVPTSRSSTSGLPMRKMATRRRLQPGVPHRATAAGPGSPGSTGPTIPNSSICMRSVRWQGISTSSARAGWCSSSTPRRSGSARRRSPTRAASSASRPQATRCSSSGCAATSGAATTAAPRGPRSRPDCRQRSSPRRAPRSGAILLADAGGRIAASSDGGRTFAPIAVEAADAAHRLRRPRRRASSCWSGPRGVAVSETASR